MIEKENNNRTGVPMIEILFHTKECYQNYFTD